MAAGEEIVLFRKMVKNGGMATQIAVTVVISRIRRLVKQWHNLNEQINERKEQQQEEKVAHHDLKV